MKQVTAVEWLQMQLKENMLTSAKELDKLFNQAKAMEKEQIENAWINGMKSNQNNFQGI